MAFKRESNFDKIDKIDAERSDPVQPEAQAMSVTRGCPVTSGNMRYPETCVVDVDRGRWPAWLRPHVGCMRRLQTRKDPDYGFVTDNFSSFALTALVANEPGDGPYMYDRLKKAAKAAGWFVEESTPGRRFDAYGPACVGEEP